LFVIHEFVPRCRFLKSYKRLKPEGKQLRTMSTTFTPRRRVSFRPYAEVKQILPLVDPDVKSQLYYSRRELRMMRKEAKRYKILTKHFLIEKCQRILLERQLQLIYENLKIRQHELSTNLPR